MLSVEEAIGRIVAAVPTLEPRRVTLCQALGLVLAEEVAAAEDLPPFANSAMDGYAVVAADTAAASSEAPRVLRVVEDVAAGDEPAMTIEPGTAARIMTGAPLPGGADAVVRVEWTGRSDNGTVRVMRPVRSGQDVRPAGEDVARGRTALRRGTLLRPAEVGMLAAVGCAEVLVTPAPTVAILTTGRELVEPGQPLPAGHIRDSNRYSLAAQVAWHGAHLGPVLHAADEPGEVEAALRRCEQADVVITSGGVSVGDFDFVKQALAAVGRVEFWKVAIRPGKPFVFGELNGKPLFGLPGNPVSSMVAFEVLVRPALERMRGLRPRPAVRARLGSEVAHAPDRRTYLRARCAEREGALIAHPVAAQGSGQITSMVEADALAVIPEGRDRVEAGEWIEVLPLWTKGIWRPA